MAAATTMPSTAGRKKKVHPFHIFKYVFLILASIISIFPFLWMIICATNDAVDINRGTVTFGTSLFKNLQNLFVTDHGFLKALGNSAIIAVITTVLALLVSSAAGYGFEMFRTKNRDRVFNFLLLDDDSIRNPDDSVVPDFR